MGGYLNKGIQESTEVRTDVRLLREARTVPYSRTPRLDRNRTVRVPYNRTLWQQR